MYGSAADQEFREEHSDLNILCLLQRMDAGELKKLQPVGLWWWRKGHPTPLLFTLGELQDSADVFAIELLDMKQRHRMLLGDDFLNGFEVPMACTACRSSANCAPASSACVRRFCARGAGAPNCPS